MLSSLKGAPVHHSNRTTARVFASCVLLLIVSTQLRAGIFHVRPGFGSGNGSGSDWNNAFSSFGDVPWGSTGVSAGDTLFVAGGTYTIGMSIGVGGAEGAPVVIRRATGHSHGSDHGWSSTFDRQVVLNDRSITLSASNITINGVVKDGIKIKRNGHGRQDKGVEFTGESNNIVLRNLEIEGPGYPTASDGRGMDLTPSKGYSDNILIEHCRIYNFPNGIYLLNCRDVLVQYCEIYNLMNTGHIHENGLYSANSTNVTYRYNRMWNAAAEGVYTPTDQSHWYVYGNVFYNSWYGFATKAGYVHTNMHVHNNTFYNVHIAIAFKNSADKGSAHNNLFYDTPVIMWGGVSHSSNLILTDNSCFIDCDKFDFRLREGSKPIDAGIALSSVYSTDAFGATRGADGRWDIGAFECDAGFGISAPDTVFILSGSIVSEPMTCINAAGQVTWSIDEGSLPEGIALSEAGELNGTAAGEQTVDVWLRAVDSDGTSALKLITIRVLPDPPLVLEQITALGTDGLELVFNRAIEPQTALDLLRYRIDNGVEILRAIIGDAKVELFTSEHIPENVYSFCASGLAAAAPSLQELSDSCLNYIPPPAVTLEAEEGTIVSPFTLLSDSNASGGAFIRTSESENGEVAYTFQIDSPAMYEFLARVAIGGQGANSYYISINDAPVDIWDITTDSLTWSWAPMAMRGAGTFDRPEQDTIVKLLEPGIHTIRLRGREKATSLDKLVIRARQTEAPTSIREAGILEIGQSRIAVVPHAGGRAFTIGLESSTAGELTVELLDMQGRRRGAMLRMDLSAGAHRVNFEPLKRGEALPQGVYMLRVNGAGRTLTRKVTIGGMR